MPLFGFALPLPLSFPVLSWFAYIWSCLTLIYLNMVLLYLYLPTSDPALLWLAYIWSCLTLVLLNIILPKSDFSTSDPASPWFAYIWSSFALIFPKTDPALPWISYIWSCHIVICFHLVLTYPYFGNIWSCLTFGSNRLQCSFVSFPVCVAAPCQLSTVNDLVWSSPFHDKKIYMHVLRHVKKTIIYITIFSQNHKLDKKFMN